MALVLPEANTVAMNLMLAELSQALPAQTHAVLVLDRAGWHLSDALQIPSNMTLVHLPSHAPELNPVEKVWQYLRDRWLSHLVLPDYRAVLDGVCRAWSSLSLLRVGRERPNGWAGLHPLLRTLLRGRSR